MLVGHLQTYTLVSYPDKNTVFQIPVSSSQLIRNLQVSRNLRYHIPIVLILGIIKSLIHPIQVNQDYTYPCEQIRFGGGHKMDIGRINNVVDLLKELQSR